MKSKIGIAMLVVGMLIVFQGSCIAVNPGTAISGALMHGIRNPAGLQGLVTPEFSMQLRIVSGESQQYQISYAEPDYGTGAGLLHILYQESLRQITYSVAADLLETTDAGVALHYISVPEPGNKYISTDLGLQLNLDHLSWLRFGLLVENFWHLKLGETETALPTNVTIGAAVDLAGYGVLALDINDAWNINSARKLLAGVELYPTPDLALRARWIDSLGLGIGYTHQQMRIDYDWAAGEHQLCFRWQF